MVRFADNGTISVDISGDTYTLKRPNIKQMMYYWDRIDHYADQARETFSGWLKEMAEYEEDSDEFAELNQRITRAGKTSYEHLVFPWLREVFAELGNKELPDDLDDAPSDLTSLRLPMEIIEWWRTVPLARSASRKT